MQTFSDERVNPLSQTKHIAGLPVEHYLQLGSHTPGTVTPPMVTETCPV